MKKMEGIGKTGRIFLMGLLIAAAAVMATGCATAVPKLYVPESELPKTKLIIVRVDTYKEFKLNEERKELTFSDPIDAEYGRIFKETFVKELESKGFVVISHTSKVNNNDFLVIEVSFADKPPLIPFTNGLLAQTTIIKNKKRKCCGG